jgi:hypothetical protein
MVSYIYVFEGKQRLIMNKNHYKYYQLRTQFENEHMHPPTLPLPQVFNRIQELLISKKKLCPLPL